MCRQSASQPQLPSQGLLCGLTSVPVRGAFLTHHRTEAPARGGGCGEARPLLPEPAVLSRLRWSCSLASVPWKVRASVCGVKGQGDGDPGCARCDFPLYKTTCFSGLCPGTKGVLLPAEGESGGDVSWGLQVPPPPGSGGRRHCRLQVKGQRLRLCVSGVLLLVSPRKEGKLVLGAVSVFTCVGRPHPVSRETLDLNTGLCDDRNV